MMGTWKIETLDTAAGVEVSSADRLDEDGAIRCPVCGAVASGGACSWCSGDADQGDDTVGGVL